jgi:hypothetical protein
VKRHSPQDDDPFEWIREQTHRIGVTAILAFGLLVGWGICNLLAGAEMLAPDYRGIPRLFATYFGWGSLILAVAALLRYGYLCAYLRWFLGRRQ